MEERMHWDPTWQSGWFLGMHLVWWVFWVVVIVAILAALIRSAGPAAPGAESPLEILRKRYAQGAVTTAEFEERRAKLVESGVR
jgi:putative membrane protein